MKTILITLASVATLFAVSCSCHPGSSAPAECTKAPAYVAPSGK